MLSPGEFGGSGSHSSSSGIIPSKRLLKGVTQMELMWGILIGFGSGSVTMLIGALAGAAIAKNNIEKEGSDVSK